MPLCKFTNHVCVECGYQLAAHLPPNTKRNCGSKAKRKKGDCQHLGPALPETLTLKVLCKGCNGKLQWQEQTFTAHECAVHGRCNPSYACSKDAMEESVVEGTWAEPCPCDDFKARAT